MRFLALKESNILSIHCMALIAASENNGINVKTVAELTNCSRHHLAKLMERLTSAGLVHAKRGQTGGFYLKKPATDIYLIDVFEALNGKIDENIICPSGKNLCEKSNIMFGNLCSEISEQFVNYLKNTPLEALKERAKSVLDNNPTTT